MKAIIAGKKYDTETAKKVASWWNGFSTSDFKYCSEELFVTGKGTFFLHGEGGAMSKYSEPCGNAVGCGSKLIPLTDIEAKEWLEHTENYDVLEELFSDDIEEA